MFNELNKIATKAYAPYSNFHVAVIFEMFDGNKYSGINIENSAYPSSMCAERVGLFSMINNQIDLSKIKAIHIYSPNSNDYLSPCGGCRQVLNEHIASDIDFYLYNKKGEYIIKKFFEIMPLPIKKENIRGS